MEQDNKKGSFLTRHLDAAGEHYLEHLLFTLRIGVRLFIAGAVVIIHGLMPFILTTTCSTMIAHVNGLLSERRTALDAAGRPDRRSRYCCTAATIFFAITTKTLYGDFSYGNKQV